MFSGAWIIPHSRMYGIPRSEATYCTDLSIVPRSTLTSSFDRTAPRAKSDETDNTTHDEVIQIPYLSAAPKTLMFGAGHNRV